MTRWSKKDLTGILLDNQKKVKGDQWEVVEFPAIMDHGDKKKPVWPEYWKLSELRKQLKQHYRLENGTHNGCKSLLLKKEH